MCTRPHSHPDPLVRGKLISRHASPHVCPVSDTASADASADKSGPTIRDIVLQHDHECVESRIVPDEEGLIRDTVRAWADKGAADWIITTGGTGFGVRDRTPEVCMAVGTGGSS